MIIERINLVPQKPISEKIKRTTPLIIGLLLGVVLLYLTGNYYFLENRIAKAGKDLTKIQSKIDQVAQYQAQEQILTKGIVELTEQAKDLRTNVASISSIQRKKRNLSKTLARLAELLPSTVKCNQVSFQNNSGQISGIALRYKDLTHFVDILKRDTLFSKAIIQDIDRSLTDDRNRLAYRIILELN